MSAAAGVCNGLVDGHHHGTALTSLRHALTCGFVNAGANSQIPVSRNCFTRLRNLGREERTWIKKRVEEEKEIENDVDLPQKVAASRS